MVTGGRGMLGRSLQQVVCYDLPAVISFKFVDIEEVA
jgi:hypothetical protein